MRPINFHAVIAATPTPFTTDLAVDEPALRRYMRWVADRGVAAVAVNADSGEGSSLSRDERRRIIEVVAEEIGDGTGIVAGIVASYTAQAVELARDAAAAGADALLVFPLAAYLGEPLPPELPYHYHAAIADAVDLPLILFQMPKDLGGVFYSPDTLERLLGIESVAAMKEASFDGQVFTQTLQLVHSARPGVALMTGNDTFIRESFILGADGALIGFGAIAGREVGDLLSAVRGRDYARADAIAASIQPLAEAIYARPLRDARARLKHALALMGVLDVAAVRPPLLPLGEGEQHRVARALEPLRTPAGRP